MDDDEIDAFTVGKFLSVFALVAAGIFGVVWVASELDLKYQAHFAPQQEAIRRTTFEQSKAYNQGTIQELRKAQVDFARAKDQSERSAIASFALHQIADYPRESLPPDLQAFVTQLQTQVTQ